MEFGEVSRFRYFTQLNLFSKMLVHKFFGTDHLLQQVLF